VSAGGGYVAVALVLIPVILAVVLLVARIADPWASIACVVLFLMALRWAVRAYSREI
jgi:hypothetical protein